MKSVAPLGVALGVFILLVANIVGRGSAHSPLECKGTIIESADQHNIMVRCDDGRSFNYHTYKYSFTKKQLP